MARTTRLSPLRRLLTGTLAPSIWLLFVCAMPLAWANPADAQPHTLTVILDGVGRGTVTSPDALECVDAPVRSCSGSFTTGTPVRLTATADSRPPGSRFVGWLECTGPGVCVVTPDVTTKTVTMDRPKTVLATFDTTTTAVVAGTFHACARLSDGAVRCWGSNGYGQLGDGTTTDSSGPVLVGGLARGAIEIAAGTDHTCARLSDSTVWCWGANYWAQLGGGTTAANSPLPVQVGGLPANVAVQRIEAGGHHTCAVLANGSVWCWGDNTYRQLGADTPAVSAAPLRVSGFPANTTATAVTAGAFHTCARLSNDTVHCWGSNGYGQLGVDLTTPLSSAPVAVSGLPSIVRAVTAGSGHTCALTGSAVWCWGDNFRGQLGDPNTGVMWEDRPTRSFRPVQVVDISTAYSVAAGGQHTCASLLNGTVRCWGYNDQGQLGTSTTPVDVGMNRAAPLARRPVQVGGISGASAVVAGGAYACARLWDPTAYCWGGRPAFSSTAALVGPVTVPLTVTKAGSGRGRVISTPGGIDCGPTATCSASFIRGRSVLLSAAPGDTGSIFAGWSACTPPADCRVTVGTPKSVTATFLLVPVADYNFQHGLASSVPGAPDLTSAGLPTYADNTTVEAGMAARTVLAFTVNDHLYVGTSGVIPTSAYSIVVLFRFDFEGTDATARILDLKDGCRDTGLYADNGTLQFRYDLGRDDRPQGVATSPGIRAGTFVQAVLTRDNARRVVFYLDGGPSSTARQVLKGAFGDTDLAVINAAGILRFFRDNVSGTENVTCVGVAGEFGENARGAVARIRFYNGALSEAEVGALDW